MRVKLTSVPASALLVAAATSTAVSKGTELPENNRMEYNDRLRPLLQLLALLEYRDGDNWCDVHPVLRKLLND